MYISPPTPTTYIIKTIIYLLTAPDPHNSKCLHVTGKIMEVRRTNIKDTGQQERKNMVSLGNWQAGSRGGC